MQLRAFYVIHFYRCVMDMDFEYSFIKFLDQLSRVNILG
jgi:hypothetical protein